jgi:hypothetical protein
MRDTTPKIAPNHAPSPEPVHLIRPDITLFRSMLASLQSFMKIVSNQELTRRINFLYAANLILRAITPAV